MSVTVTLHASERTSEYGYTKVERSDLVGETVPERLWEPGDPAPTPGRPVMIGRQPPPMGSGDRRVLLSGVTRRGRFGISVVTVRSDGTPGVVVTIWDPTSSENAGKWHPDLLGPTKAGARTLPPCTFWAVRPR